MIRRGGRPPRITRNASVANCHGIASVSVSSMLIQEVCIILNNLPENINTNNNFLRIEINYKACKNNKI